MFKKAWTRLLIGFLNKLHGGRPRGQKTIKGATITYHQLDPGINQGSILTSTLAVGTFAQKFTTDMLGMLWVKTVKTMAAEEMAKTNTQSNMDKQVTAYAHYPILLGWVGSAL